MASLNITQCTMNQEEVLAIVAAHQEELTRLGVKSLNLFGSVARNEARPDSDVDILVEFTQPGGFFQLWRVQHYGSSKQVVILEIETLALRWSNHYIFITTFVLTTNQRLKSKLTNLGQNVVG